MQESRLITRKSASNLAMAFVLLPKAKRHAMAALYAFCRHVDDIADDVGPSVAQRRQSLGEWREDVRRACVGETPRFEVNCELKPVIDQHRLSFELFDDLIRGVEMDLDIKRYESYEALDVYCYRVASVVGLLSIEVFGYQDPACRDYAVHLGKALQLTNILRDVRSDAMRDRIYLPQAELARFGVTDEQILRGHYSDAFAALGASVGARARDFYQKARQALPTVDRRSMVAAELMGAVYWRLLGKLERQRFNVFMQQPTRLSKPHKALLVLRTWLKVAFGGMTPNYGA